jgi:hypothetical protein
MDYGVARRRTSPSKVGPAVARVSTLIEGAEWEGGLQWPCEGGKIAFDVVEYRGKQAAENLWVK